MADARCELSKGVLMVILIELTISAIQTVQTILKLHSLEVLVLVKFHRH